MNYLRWLVYFVSEAFQNIKANIVTSIVTIATIAISLAICGLFLGIFINLSNMLISMGSQIQVIAYMRDDISVDAISNIKRDAAVMPEVESLEYISKEMAFSVFKEELKGQKGILEGLGATPFPASLEIKVKELFRTPQGIRGLISKLKITGGIEDVQYGQEWLNRFFAFIRFVEVFALIIGGFLILATIFIVSNTIKLAVYARREEIEILGLMGATGIFIKAPFLIEGIVEGFLGANLAIGLLYTVREVLILKTSMIFTSLVDLPVSTTYFMCGLIAGGIFLGILGSSISLKKSFSLLS
ncbi:MAG: permease-like cell division protein FtsX [Deltaproteobacteria bacterium]